LSATIHQYFDNIEASILQSPVIESYQIIRSEISGNEGKLRIKASLQNNDSVELFIYVSEIKTRIQLLKYSFHWQDQHTNLIKRWDNAPHYPNIPNAPHHIHEADGSVSGNANTPDIFYVLQEIEAQILL